MPATHLGFGPYSFDRSGKLLFRDGQFVEAGQRGVALLRALAEAGGEVVTKAELLSKVWPDVIVDEGNLTAQVAGLRKALGPRPEGGDWIATVPRVGYRLAATAVAGANAHRAPPSLAVLPFQNLSSDREQEYFADGIVDDITTALSRFHSLAVVARNSSFVYKGRAVDVRQVAQELGVRYVLEGSVRRAGLQLRVNAQLIEGTTGAHIWAHNYDGGLEDVFDVQDRIVASVVAVVAPRIEQAELERSHRERPGSLAVYDLYLRALQKFELMDQQSHAGAVALLEHAVSLSADFAPALALLANLLEHRITMGWPHSDDDRGNSIRFARRALKLANDDAVVLAHGGMVLMNVLGDCDGAVITLERAVAINPNNAMVVEYAGVTQIFGGDLGRGVRHCERAIELNPSAAAYASMSSIAAAKLFSGEYEESLAWAARALAANPNYNPTHWYRIAALAYLGRYSEAKGAIKTLRELVPDMAIDRLPGVWRDPKQWEAIADGLRLAGLPEA